MNKAALALALGFAMLANPSARAQDPAGSDAELARKLANPIAAMTSIPFKANWDTGIGSGESERTTWIIQPVIPFTLNSDWNLITRTIIPYVDQSGPSGSSGLGDITQSFFFSPSSTTDSGWTWGAGPVISYPSASNGRLGSEKWAAGPTVVALKQSRGVTYGVLANHLVSFAGEDDRADVNATFVQPFVSVTTRRLTTFGLNTETTYDWETDQATIPVNLSVTQLFKVGQQPMSLALGYRHYLDAPPGGPDRGMSLTYTLLLPR